MEKPSLIDDPHFPSEGYAAEPQKASLISQCALCEAYTLSRLGSSIPTFEGYSKFFCDECIETYGQQLFNL